MHRTAIIARFAGVLATLLDRLGAVVRGIAFWTATLLPVAYPPLLLFGPVTTAELWTLAGLVPVNVAALVLGHGYGRSPSGAADGPE